MTRFFVALCAAWSAGLASGNPVVLVDNLDRSAVSVNGMVQGSNPHCLSDAHAGGFVQGGTNLGNTNVSFTFSPPTDGCYEVEEYHPGSSDTCSQFLAKAVAVDIEYSVGKLARGVLDQSVFGGHWTTFGSFPFYRGHQGRITFSSVPAADRPDHPQCDAALTNGTCIFVGDAVRVRWLAETCRERAAPVLAEEVHVPAEEGPSLLVLGLVLSGAAAGAGLAGMALYMRQRSLRKKRVSEVAKGATARGTEVAALEGTTDEKGTPLPADSDTKDDVASVSTDAPSEGADSRSCGSLHGPDEIQSCDGI